MKGSSARNFPNGQFVGWNFFLLENPWLIVVIRKATHHFSEKIKTWKLAVDDDVSVLFSEN